MMNADSINRTRKTRYELTEFVNKVAPIYGSDATIQELMKLRGYTDPNMHRTLKEMGLFKFNGLTDILLATTDYKKHHYERFGILTSKGDYLLSGRYVLPIRGIDGQVCALVGWDENGGARKYVTSTTYGFSRDATFFNFDAYTLAMEKFGGSVFLVEGIFDAVALRSLGLPAIGLEGLELSGYKRQMLRRFGKVIAIPDNDSSGKEVNPITNTGKTRHKPWVIENEHVFVSLPSGVKDIDLLVRDFYCYEDLVNLLDGVRYYKKLSED